MHMQRSAEADTNWHLVSNFQPKFIDYKIIILGTSEPISEMELGSFHLCTSSSTLKLRTPKINEPLNNIHWWKDFREDEENCTLGAPWGHLGNSTGDVGCNPPPSPEALALSESRALLLHVGWHLSLAG